MDVEKDGVTFDAERCGPTSPVRSSLSLRGRRMSVFFMGERVPEPVNHPVIRPSINAMAKTHRLASVQPELASGGLLACRDDGFLLRPADAKSLRR